MHGKPKSIAKRSDIRITVAAETDRAIALARRLGKRLRHQLDLAKDLSLPDEDWREMFKAYGRLVAELGRLAAGEVGKPDKSGDAMADEEYRSELREIAITQLRGASAEEAAQLLRDAGIDPADLDPEPTRLS